MGKDPKYVCWKASSSKSGEPTAMPSNAVAQVQSTSNEGGSSDEEDDDEEEQSSNQAQVEIFPSNLLHSITIQSTRSTRTLSRI